MKLTVARENVFDAQVTTPKDALGINETTHRML
jgi:hypothetical protein